MKRAQLMALVSATLPDEFFELLERAEAAADGLYYNAMVELRAELAAETIRNEGRCKMLREQLDAADARRATRSAGGRTS